MTWFLATRFGRPIAIVGIAVTVLLFIPYFLIQPRFSFEDVMSKSSSALTAAEQIDAGVGGVAPLYVRVPLKEGLAEVGDTNFERIRTVHDIVEKHLGDNKAISAAAFRRSTDSGFSRQDVFEAVGPFLKRRFVTDDNTQALVTGFMPTIIIRTISSSWCSTSARTSTRRSCRTRKSAASASSRRSRPTASCAGCSST